MVFLKEMETFCFMRLLKVVQNGKSYVVDRYKKPPLLHVYVTGEVIL
jgi:hypothetical protein